VNWNCTFTEDKLSDFLSGALTAEENAALSAHAIGCADCSQLIRDVESLVSRMHALAPVEAPRYLAGKILSQTLAPQRQGAAGWFDWLAIVWQPRFAMGLATIAASLMIVLHAVNVRPNQFTIADLNPAVLVRGANRQAHLGFARSVKFVNDLRVIYEIESRLQPQPENVAPFTEPSTAPAPSPQSNPQSPSPGRVPGKTPSSGRRAAISGTEMAAIMITSVISNDLPKSSPRSAP
jgi:Putative zinc-finger